MNDNNVENSEYIKKNFYKMLVFLFILFLISYLFVAYNRLSNGAPLSILFSLYHAIRFSLPIIVGVFIISILKTYPETVLSKVLKNFRVPIILIATLLSSWYGLSYLMQCSGENCMGMIFVAPIFFAFASLISFILLYFLNSIVLSSRKSINIALCFEIIILLIFLVLDVLLINHCGTKGCISLDYMSKAAVSNNDPRYCSYKELLKKDILLKKIRLDIPLIFVYNRFVWDGKDWYPPKIESECYYKSAQIGKSVKFCQSTDSTSEEYCIEQAIKVNPDSKECEGLSLNDFCYFTVAKYTQDKSNCAKIKNNAAWSMKEICETVSSRDVQACLTKYETGVIQGRCLDAIFSVYTQPGECAKLSNKRHKDICYFNLASGTKNDTYCENISPSASTEYFSKNECRAAVMQLLDNEKFRGY